MKVLKKEMGHSNAYVDGGRLVQSFSKEGLIATYEVNTIPVLLGSGVRLFGDLGGDVELAVLSSESFLSGCVQTKCEVVVRNENAGKAMDITQEDEGHDEDGRGDGGSGCKAA